MHDAYVAIATTSRLNTEHRIDMDVAAALAINAYGAQRLFICSLLAGTTIGVSVVLTAVLVVSMLDSRGTLPGDGPAGYCHVIAVGVSEFPFS